MNKSDLVTLYTRATPFDDEHFICKTFEIYAAFDHVKGCTRITIINSVTKRECIIYLDYIQKDENLIFKAAKAMIDTNLLN